MAKRISARRNGDENSRAAIVERLTLIHEARFTPPWKPDLSETRTERMLDFLLRPGAR